MLGERTCQVGCERVGFGTLKGGGGGWTLGLKGRNRLEMGPLSLHTCVKSLPCEGPEPEGSSRNNSVVTADGARSPPQSLSTGARGGG